MDETKPEVMHPIAVFKSALLIWFKNLIPAAALYSVNILLLKILYLSSNACGLEPQATAAAKSGLAAGQPGCVNLLLAALFVLEVIAVLVLNAFFCLMVLNYFKLRSKGKASFAEIFGETRKAILFYVKALFLLLIFVTVVAGAGFVFYWAGYGFYAGAGAAGQGLKMAVLLLASTLCVGLLIAAFWYGFFFSLAPLVAAFEKKKPWQAMRQSRSRIKGQALRYVFALLMCAVTYFVVGLAAYFVLTRVTDDRLFLELLDPAMATFFGPLWLAVWLVSYERLKELKKD